MRWLPCLTAFLLLMPVQVSALTIVVGKLSDLNNCDLESVQPFVPFYLYVGVVSNVAGQGIRGAEFRVDGVDPSWFVTATPNPNATIVGSPHEGGCSVSFSQCQDTQYPLILCTLWCIATSAVSPRVVIARAHNNPANALFACPNVLLCDGPVATRGCLPSCGLCVNQTCTSQNCHGPSVCEGPLAIEAGTWSRVKRLYEVRDDK